jgi:polyhydroxyalkanoate synthesis repressor PhaR
LQRTKKVLREPNVSEANSGAGGKPEGAKSGKSPGDRVVIKKYANRRLYNTGSSSYVTLEHLREMVKEGVDFVVYDAKTGEDITRSVLGQIIFEEESRGEQNLLPIQFLRQLISFYGGQMQSLVPSYLELSLNAFTQQQERMREQFSGAFGGGDAYGMFQEQVRQNMALFDRAMKMFTPFAYMPQDGAAPVPGAAPQPAPQPAAKPEAPAAPSGGGEDSLADLKARVEEMQRQIERLATGGR